ncbi:MAG: hypothetical protein GY774_06905, partial [Planctomycetes bacterium]|nr:hypothetical protein [Planctomycetota bacterium]
TTGADAIQFNEVVVIKYTQPSTLNYPYGSEVGNSDIYLENGNPLPFYIDSLEYGDDKVEILDADDTGFLYVKPQRTRFANDYEMREIFGTDIITTGTDGVCIYSDVNTQVTDYTATSANGDNLAYRGVGDIPTAYCSQTSGNIGEDRGYLSTNFVGAYDIQDPEKYSTLNVSLESTLSGVDWSGGAVSANRDLNSIVLIKTVGGLKIVSSSINSGVINRNVSYYTVDDYLLPKSMDAPTVDHANFRYSNNSVSQRI